MICSDCKIGGELNARGVALLNAGNVHKAEETFDAAQSVHDRCRGCVCQHTVGVDLVQGRRVGVPGYGVDVEGRPE